MGMYDTYADVQLKVGPCELAAYSFGDEVPIKDGVYVAPDGIVVIADGKLFNVYTHVTSKWGDKITPEQILEPTQ